MTIKHIRVIAERAFTRPVLAKSLRVAVVVGTILNAINHGGALLDGENFGWPSVVLNYFVPFCVSCYSMATMQRGSQ